MRYYSFLRLILTVCLIHFYTFLAAQEEEGDFVVLSNGEKLSGEVVRDFDYSQYNVSRITFIDQRGESRVFTPEEIQSFGFSNGRLFTAKVLPEVRGKVFAREIFTGRLSLFGYRERFFIESEYETVELRPGVDVSTRESLNLKVFEKPYIETLALMMAGVCGSQLIDKLNRTLFSEESFIHILSKYHDCERIAYRVNVEKIKVLRISPFLGGGYMSFINVVNNRPEGRKDILSQSGMSFLQAGVKVYQFRNLPKIGFDLGIGFASIDNQINSEYIHPEVTYTGTENFKLSTLIVPVFFNYSVLRLGLTETYFGFGGIYSHNKLESYDAIRDLTTNYNSTTILEERAFLRWSKNVVSPSAKIGTHINAYKSLGLLVEFRVDYASSVFMSDLDLNKSFYNQFTSSVLIAVRY